MNYLKSLIVNLVKQEDGPTAVEYAIMLGLIVVVCIAAISAIGESTRGIFETLSESF